MNARDIASRIVERLPSRPLEDSRFVVAIAGPPAAGKSTVSAEVLRQVDGRAGLLGMDAFHFDNGILDLRDHRSRKGAPHTFDVASYDAWLRILASDRSRPYAVPVYDRALSAARNCAALIEPDHDILVTEGNYLLVDDEPWSALRPHFDLTVWLDVDLETVEERIRDRWVSAGHPNVEIERRTVDNDLPNARFVHERSTEADLVVPTTMPR